MPFSLLTNPLRIKDLRTHTRNNTRRPHRKADTPTHLQPQPLLPRPTLVHGLPSLHCYPKLCQERSRTKHVFPSRCLARSPFCWWRRISSPRVGEHLLYTSVESRAKVNYFANPTIKPQSGTKRGIEDDEAVLINLAPLTTMQLSRRLRTG